MANIDVVSLAGLFEPVSSLTHLAGAVVFAVMTVFLLRDGGKNTTRKLALGVFALSAVMLLSVSGVYHIFAPGATRALMLRIDSAGIFLLIAATYTPIHTILFRGLWQWGFLSLIWSLAVSAAALKTMFFAEVSDWLSLSLYLGLGWMGLISATVVARQNTIAFIQLILWGGVCYTVGGVVNLVRAPIFIPGVFGPHEFFHLAVLAGLACHWRFIYMISAEIPMAKFAPAKVRFARVNPTTTIS